MPFPVTRHRCSHRVADDDLRQCPVVGATVALQPSGMIGVLVEVLRANVMVLALHHAAQAGKIAFHHVCVAVVAVNLGVVHAINVPSHV